MRYEKTIWIDRDENPFWGTFETPPPLEPTFSFRPDFPRIPASLWGAVLALFHKYADQQAEVYVSLLISEDGQQWRAGVPNQVISSANVQVQYDRVLDLETGERLDPYPPAGWREAGDIHSHNIMSAFFSPTDDISDITRPGLHIVVGNLDKSPQAVARITRRKTFFSVDLDQVLEWGEPTSYHPAVEQNITTLRARVSSKDYPKLPLFEPKKFKAQPAKKKFRQQLQDLVYYIVSSTDPVAEIQNMAYDPQTQALLPELEDYFCDLAEAVNQSLFL